MPEPGGLEPLLAGFAEELELGLVAGDEEDSERVARDALGAGLPATLIDDHVVRPAMRSLGERWARGEITPSVERRATQIVLRLLAVLRDIHRVEQQRLDSTVLLCAPEGERHVVGLHMAADLLEDAGYTVLVAGPDVAAESLAALIERHRPQLLGLTATMSQTAPSLRASVATAHEANIGGVLIGGAIAGQALDPPPVVQTVDGVAVVVSAADALLRRAGSN